MRGRTSSARIRLFNPTQQTPNIASFCLFSFFRLSLPFRPSLAPIPLVLFAVRHSCQSHLHITRLKNWSTSPRSHPHAVSSQLPCQYLLNVSLVRGCCITILRNRSFLRRFSDCKFAHFVTRVRPLEWSIILNNHRGNCRSASRSRLLPSNFAVADPTRICAFGDEVAPFSAARHRAELAINAFSSPRSFGCGCAALRNFRAGDCEVRCAVTVVRTNTTMITLICR